jgi:hypothetical protein
MREIAAALVIFSGAVVFSVGLMALPSRSDSAPPSGAFIGVVAGMCVAAYGFWLLHDTVRGGRSYPPES